MILIKATSNEASNEVSTDMEIEIISQNPETCW
jgi:hypothetical protein